MVSFALTVTAALIGYGLTSGNALIFLVPLLMLALTLIHLVLFVTGWICIVLSFFYAKGYQLVAPIVVAVLWLLFWIVVHRWIKYETSGQLERDFDAIWTEVAKAVNESRENKSKV